MITLVSWDDPEVKRLRDAQQSELADLYGEEDLGHDMTGEDIAAMVLVREDDAPVACGAIRDLGDGVGELKRMYVVPEARGRGLSRQVLAELERVAQDKGFTRLVLETGVLQVQAMSLYMSAGYRSIPNFGEYATETSSRCFAKDLHAEPRPRGAKHPGTLTLRRVPWDHPDAVALRYAMWRDIEVRYPEIVAAVPGGFAVDDPQQGVGTISSVIADLDGVPVGCASLRAARHGFPAGSGELKKVWVNDDARGAGAARALLIAIEDDARAAGLTSVVLQTGIRQPEAVTLYLSVGYRPIAPFGPYTDDLLSLLFGKAL
ncbi:GNAT family N-acetyltransferase [Cellulomonas sp. URHE0023]|uniref:GNAT family N-acetyltransferase n=1 Tax=Cellulomonas sp. URHE0023 TaxID=1380354 RepID=UPI000AA764C9|nr:GNAT family N-acetyltransferase [Cellulomonas sp. URHE0023]